MWPFRGDLCYYNLQKKYSLSFPKPFPDPFPEPFPYWRFHDCCFSFSFLGSPVNTERVGKVFAWAGKGFTV